MHFVCLNISATFWRNPSPDATEGSVPRRPDLANLHRELFLKLPWEPEWHMRAELSLGMGDGDGLEIAAYAYVRRADIPLMNRGDAAAATRRFREDTARRRRGCHAEIP